MFTVGGGATGWSSEITYSEGMDKFLTLSDTVNAVQTDEVRIKLAVMENGSVERSAKIILSTTGQGSEFSSAKDSLTITQDGAPPTFMLTSDSVETIAHDAETASDITFNVGGGATGWRSAAIVYNPTTDAGGEEFITLTGEKDMRGDVTVTVTSRVNTGVDRSAAITIATVGGTGDALDTMITITQSAGPPTLEVSMPTPKSGSDTTIAYGATTNILDIIAFTVGGGATSWTAAVIDDDNTNNFLELVEHDGGTAGTGIIGVRARENTGGTRMDTVVITTVGGFGDPLKDTIVITQRGARPTLMVSTPTQKLGSDTTIAYDATALDIEFTVGGGATGWIALSIDGDTLESGNAGTGTINVSFDENTGEELMDTIVIATVGGTGEATDTIIVTQEAVPTISLTDPVDGMIVIDYNAVTDTTITFNVGGSATGWTASSDNDFVTLDITSGASGTGIEVMATVMENMDVLRATTITITTVGQLGAAKTATVMITQTGALGSPTLSVTTPSGDTTVAYTTDSVEIVFTVGNATGWESMISYRAEVDTFLTLTGNSSDTGEVRIKVAVTENDSVERSAKIVLSTTGQTGFSSAKDSLTITQDGAPPTFMLTSDSAETIAYDAESASDITFEVGGGATGWWARVIDGNSDNNFVILDKTSGSAGLDTIKVAVSENMGLSRVDTIVITTDGGTGSAIDTIIVTQEAVPTLMITTFNDTTINHNAGELSITFTLGGTAKGWTSEVKGDGFITLDPAMNASDTNTAVSIMATYEVNTGERTDTIIFITTGGVS